MTSVILSTEDVEKLLFPNNENKMKQKFTEIELRLMLLKQMNQQEKTQMIIEEQLCHQAQVEDKRLEQERTDIDNEIKEIKEIKEIERINSKKSIIKSFDRKNSLVKWLKKRCDYSDDVIKDPGYSNFYKSEFCIRDGVNFRKFYELNDIDYDLNNLNNLSVMCVNHDPILDQYVDRIPIEISKDLIDAAVVNASYHERADIIDDMTHLNMLILPGSNHSNANYLFKRLMRYSEENIRSYNIPYVSVNHKMSYKGDNRNAKLNINKEQFYEFLRLRSQK